MELINDIFADALVIFRDNAEFLVVVEGSGEVVDHETVNPSTDEADDDHTEVIDEEGRAADNGAGNGDGGTDVEVEELVDNLGQDVETTSGSVDALSSSTKQQRSSQGSPMTEGEWVVMFSTAMLLQG